MPSEPVDMKWWGWGDQNKRFDMECRPALWKFAQRVLRLPDEMEAQNPIDFDSITLPLKNIDARFLHEAKSVVDCKWISDTKLARLTHAFGKSFRDLWRIRRGIVPYAPDLVIYPDSHFEVCALVDLACLHGVHLVPFGGGSNIAGCLEPVSQTGQMCVALDMRRMDRLLSLDARSGIARVEAGALGPRLEEQLNEQNFTLGHFPDSFLYSTLGGWVATRSAGMLSDRYGKIEDMVVAIRMVTPSGTIETRRLPRASNGVDVNRLCIGSEGSLGVITEVDLLVHRMPERKATYAYLFESFETGLQAMLDCQHSGVVPSMMRLNDPNKTGLSAAYSKAPSRFKRIISQALTRYIKHIRRWKPESICLMLASFEGTAARFDAERQAANAILRSHRAFPLGDSPGKSFNEGKFDFPYLRDYLFEREVLCDVTDTATSWSNLMPLYTSVTTALQRAFDAEGVNGYVGCHLSHSYHAGASLYFTFAWDARPDEKQARDHQIKQYFRIKKASLDACLANGATFSHHHAVGYEHMPWLESDISAPGVAAVRALKNGLDPKNIMNPGRLSGHFSIDDWTATGLGDI